MITRFSASAWSTALIDFSRDTDNGTMMNGQITRSFSGSTGRTSGILIASSLEASFGSVIEFSHYRLQWLFPYITFVRRESPETADANSDLHGKRGWRRRPPPATSPPCGTTPLLPPPAAI